MKWSLLPVALIVVLAFKASPSTQQSATGSPWTFVCRDKFCSKVFHENVSSEAGEVARDSIEVCKLNCGDYGSLWPKPTGEVTLDRNVTSVDNSSIVFDTSNVPPTLQEWLNTAESIFRGYLEQMSGIPAEPRTRTRTPPDGDGQSDVHSARLTVAFSITSDTTHLGLKTDESYRLEVVSDDESQVVNVKISASTYFGARHALETLSQLIAYDQIAREIMIVKAANITDAPIYPYRGFMIDTSRNFIPITNLYRLIDGLSYNKLNIFHWHITDTHSFPMEVPTQPNLTIYGAYSQDKVYTVQEMADIVQYARIRGVKVVPEFDQPAHVGNGWVWGPEGERDELALAVCVNKDYWHEWCVEPPCGQLNLANPAIYGVLGDIFQSMFEIFDDDIFHMGGDEVDMRCYNSTKSITDWMNEQEPTLARDQAGFMELWGRIFQQQAYTKLANATSGPENLLTILWTSELTSQEYAPKYLNSSKYAIQIWTTGDNAIIPFLINNGYRVIFSNYDAWYLDCGFHHWVLNAGHNWCSPYNTWQGAYENSPFKIYAAFEGEEKAQEAYDAGLLLGGVAPLWMEQSDENSMDSRFWPRGSAVAERLWSDPREEGAVGAATIRMVANRQRYVQRGIQADRLQPEWCYQNENKCTGEGMPDPVPTTTTTTQRPSEAAGGPVLVGTAAAATFIIVNFLTFLSSCRIN